MHASASAARAATRRRSSSHAHSAPPAVLARNWPTMIGQSSAPKASVGKRSESTTAPATLLALLYGALYVLLQSEDMALLLGAILLFGILAGIMAVTRRVDWYRITERQEPGQGGQANAE